MAYVECPYQHCDQNFDDLQQFNNHMKLEHRHPQVKCTDCEKIFASCSYLEVHRVLAHGADRKCLFCNKNFDHLTGSKFSSNLSSHLATNHFHKQCSICYLTFEIDSDLSEHQKVQHQLTEPQPAVLMCRKCSVNFKSVKSTLNHIRGHFKSKSDEAKESENGTTSKSLSVPVSDLLTFEKVHKKLVVVAQSSAQSNKDTAVPIDDPNLQHFCFVELDNDELPIANVIDKDSKNDDQYASTEQIPVKISNQMEETARVEDLLVTRGRFVMRSRFVLRS
jgi:Zinc finger, C2H2 type